MAKQQQQEQLPPEPANPWETMAANPRVMSALLNFGIAAMQPPSFGDTFASQLGRSVGSGAEAVGRQEEMDRRQQETDTKSMLREAQAAKAEAGARVAGANLGTQAERLQNQRLALQGLNDRALSLNQIKLTNGYWQAKSRWDAIENKKAIESQKAAALGMGQPYTPVPFKDFNTFAAESGLSPGSFGLTPGTVGTPSATSAEDPIAAARDAVARGAPRDKVRQRLIAEGHTPPEDL